MTVPRKKIDPTRLTEAMGDYPTRFLEGEALPFIRAKQRDTLLADVKEFIFLSELQEGDAPRCPCFAALDNQPDSECVSCYGVGTIGGWEKHGCRTHMVVASPHLGIAMLGVVPDFRSGRVPPPFRLQKSSTLGYLLVHIPAQSSTPIVDHVSLYGNIPPRTWIDVGVRTAFEEVGAVVRFSSEPEGVSPIDQLVGVLAPRLASGSLYMKITLGRTTPDDAIPHLTALRLRYQTTDEQPLVLGNMPLTDRDMQLQEAGIWEASHQRTFYLPPDLPNVRSNDVLVDPENGDVWSVYSAKRNDPHGKLNTSWFVSANQVIPGVDPSANFPAAGRRALELGEHPNPLGRSKGFTLARRRF